MTDQSYRFPRFFVTAPSPCPYIPGRTERKVFAEIKGDDARDMAEALGRIGFRRSQNVVYRPSCDSCQACVSVRVPVQRFAPGRSQKKLLARHADLEVHACQPWATEEQWALLRRYLAARHPQGGMAAMDTHDFSDMIEQSPVDTVVVEYREPSVDGRPGRLVGCCLTDKQSDGLSMIYSFYDPDAVGRPGTADRAGMGNFIIMDHIMRARRAGMTYVYLGYWIEGCDRMAYKTRFKPVEALIGGVWREQD
ncbi:arginyltransferase [Sandarakinorhabdus sp.]|uniref:arginyltransferase n=1 Tax=Sandarakinorhabdus sp. TaxID=1916663 RepID=UPI00286E5263|nr:arginyltransferase [Sandarakinorhabdus sp.]